MKRYLPLINLILFLFLLVGSLIIHHQERRIIDLQMRTIDAQAIAIETWKVRAMRCEGIVVSSK
jgi:hypothetical protein